MRRRNNRPIRTRPPGKRRPVRWIDGFSAPLDTVETEPGLFSPNPGVVPAGSIFPATTFATIDYRELVVGNIDTEWADANEVLVERIVGDIRCIGRENYPMGDPQDLNWIGMPTMVRFGMVLLEDIDEEGTPNPPSLWQTDDLADGEWMWMLQLGSPQESHMYFDTAGGAALRYWTHDLHVDIRVKRKLGRRDRLVMCHEFAHVGDTFTGSRSLDVQPLLRCLVSTK